MFVREMRKIIHMRRNMEQVLAERHERPRLLCTFAAMLESANKENSPETELREAVRRVTEAFHAGWIELIDPHGA